MCRVAASEKVNLYLAQVEDGLGVIVEKNEIF